MLTSFLATRKIFSFLNPFWNFCNVDFIEEKYFVLIYTSLNKLYLINLFLVLGKRKLSICVQAPP